MYDDEPRLGDFEQVMNLLVRARYQPVEKSMSVHDDRPPQGTGWNGNHPLFYVTTLWRPQLSNKLPDILVEYNTSHAHAAAPRLHGVLFRGKATMMRAGFVVRGTRELPWSGIRGLVDRLVDEKIIDPEHRGYYVRERELADS